MLKQEYKEGEMNLNDALLLAIKTLSKTLDMTKITADKGIVNSLFDLAVHLCSECYIKLLHSLVHVHVYLFW